MRMSPAIGAVALCILPCTPLASAEFGFDGLRELPLGIRPARLELADLDRDGDLDLVAASSGQFDDAAAGFVGAGIRVFPNPGDGSFEAFRDHPVADSPRDVAICDLDSDGWPDIVWADQRFDKLEILRNDGAGRFTGGGAVFVSIDPVRVMCVDLDGDGDRDLASADVIGLAVSVAFNGGGGSFGSSVQYPVGDVANDLQAGDVDNDGDQDLLVLLNAGPALLRNNGTGMFTGPLALPLGDVVSGFALCRLDAGQSLDLVSPNVVHLGLGDGNFNPSGIPTGLLGSRASCLDFDRDGDVDVATDSGVALYSAGSFQVIHTFTPDTYKNDLAAGDFTSDGIPDLIRLHWDAWIGKPGFATLVPGSAASLAAERRFPAGSSVWSLAAGQLGPGNLDLAVASQRGGLPDAVSVLLGRGDGSFGPAASYPAGAGVRAVGIMDLDGDTRRDVVVVNNGAGTLQVLRGDGSGGLGGPTSYPAGENPEAMAFGDFDGDGGTDVAVANYRFSTPMGSVTLLMSDGTGAFEAPVTYALPCARASGIVAARIDGDAHPDLCAICAGRPVSGLWLDQGMAVMLNRGGGTFTTPVLLTTSFQGTVDACDVDLDGDQDILATSSAALQVFLNDGSGSFPQVRSTNLPGGHSDIACADLNDDGHVDVAAPDGSQGVMTLFPGRGDGTFREPEHYASGGVPSAVVLGDLNGDGERDIAVASRGTNVVTVMLSQGPPPRDLSFLGDGLSLTWSQVTGAASYNVYRGLLSALRDLDGDMLPDSGYGDCQNHRDGSPGGTFDTLFVETEAPPQGDGFFHLVSIMGAAGEGGLGSTSSGLRRSAAATCP